MLIVVISKWAFKKIFIFLVFYNKMIAFVIMLKKLFFFKQYICENIVQKSLSNVSKLGTPLGTKPQ